MTKSVAYSAELVTAIVEQYQAGVSLETIAKDAGKTVPMIRSKLVSEKVYKAAPKVSKATGAAPVRKLALVQAISEKLDVDELTSLEKGSKADLEAMLAAITELTS